MKKITYSAQSITKKDIKAVTKILKSKFITRGPIAKKFEKKINNLTKSNYCIVTNSGTSALSIACKALKLKKGDIVWTSANSFVASSNCALICGASVDFVDIDLSTYNLNLNLLSKKLEKAKKQKKLPKIIIPVHYAGYPIDMKKLYNLKKKYGFKIIEDASHAIGSKRDNKVVGDCSYSEMTVFSFQAVKVITTGEGGCITTNDKKLYNKLKILRSHGITKEKRFFYNNYNKKFPWYYEQIDLSNNFILPDINCGLGISQLSRLKQNLNYRNGLYNYYKKKLLKTKVKLVQIEKSVQSSHHLLPAFFDFNSLNHKLNFFKFMKKKGIFLQVHYIPIYHHPFYKKFHYNISEFKNCEKFYKKVFSLPMHLNLKIKDIDYICKSLIKFLE